MLAWRLPGLAIAFILGTQSALAGSSAAVVLSGLACAFAPLPARWRLACAAAVAASVLNVRYGDRAPSYAGPSNFATIAGTVVDSDERAAFGSQVSVRSGGNVFLVRSRDAAPPLGSAVRVHGRVDAFDEARNPGEPSQRALARERGLYAQVSRAHVTVIDRNGAGALEAAPARIRAWASGAVRSRIDEPFATILAGALWGERGTLPGDVRADFQTTGTMHILVTAGLHVGIVAAVLAALFRGLRFSRMAGALSTIPIVWLYAALSGAHLPSMRAATMATVALLAVACGRRALSWNALAAAAVLIALARPSAVGTIAFALSFSCVAAIILFANPIKTFIEERGCPPFLAEAVALSVATQLGTWPLTAGTFLTVAPYAPLANAAVVPLTAAALLGGLALLASVPLGPAADLIAVPERFVLAAIAWIVHAVAALPGAHAVVTPPPGGIVALYDALAVAAAAAVRTRRIAAAGMLLAAASALVVFAGRPGIGRLTVTVLDVGQGDAIVVRTPLGHTVLIDTGGRLERGASGPADSAAERAAERTVVPYLERQGIRRIDALIVTHPHGDHVGGCAPILRALRADEVIDTGQPYGGFAYRDCRAVATARGVRIVPPPVGRTMSTDGVAFSFLAPELPYLRDTGDDVNENSIVIMLSYRGRRMLFMGDAGQDTEARLLSRGTSLRADILKVGHHGSAYASTPAFLRAVSPAVAVISVGRDNTFGHPAPQTVENLRLSGARVLRTDLCGAVTVVDLTEVQTMAGCEPPLAAAAGITPG